MELLVIHFSRHTPAGLEFRPWLWHLHDPVSMTIRSAASFRSAVVVVHPWFWGWNVDGGDTSANIGFCDRRSYPFLTAALAAACFSCSSDSLIDIISSAIFMNACNCLKTGFLGNFQAPPGDRVHLRMLDSVSSGFAPPADVGCPSVDFRKSCVRPYRSDGCRRRNERCVTSAFSTSNAWNIRVLSGLGIGEIKPWYRFSTISRMSEISRHFTLSLQISIKKQTVFTSPFASTDNHAYWPSRLRGLFVAREKRC
jgi:hypothetical protein